MKNNGKYRVLIELEEQKNNRFNALLPFFL